MTDGLGVIAFLVIGGVMGFVLALWNDDGKHRRKRVPKDDPAIKRYIEDYDRGFSFGYRQTELRARDKAWTQGELAGREAFIRDTGIVPPPPRVLK